MIWIVSGNSDPGAWHQIPDYPWSFTLYGEGYIARKYHEADFTPADDNGQKIHKDVVYEKEKFLKILREERIELNAAPSHPSPHVGLFKYDRSS